MIICQEIAEYLRYVEDNPKRINRERRLLIDNIVMPIMRRNDVFFDEKSAALTPAMAQEYNTVIPKEKIQY